MNALHAIVEAVVDIFNPRPPRRHALTAEELQLRLNEIERTRQSLQALRYSRRKPRRQRGAYLPSDEEMQAAIKNEIIAALNKRARKARE